MVPLCKECHAEQHRIGITSFEARHGLELERLALELQRDYNRVAFDA